MEHDKRKKYKQYESLFDFASISIFTFFLVLTHSPLKRYDPDPDPYPHPLKGKVSSFIYSLFSVYCEAAITPGTKPV